MIYAFILGKNPTLSVAEIITVLASLGLGFSIISLSRQALIVKWETDQNPNFLQEILGGTVKIIRILDKKPKREFDLTLYCQNFLHNLGIAKLTFGLSFYNSNTQTPKKINELGLKIKKELKAKNVRSRFVSANQTPALTSVVARSIVLKENGIEFCFIETENDFFIGKTITTQDFENYNRRDYGRPAPDPRGGMMPPKLAQILLNLSIKQRNVPNVIFDPFCGTGTILAEALLLGQIVFGSDIDKFKIDLANKNLKWFSKNFIYSGTLAGIFEADATKIKSSNLPLSPDAIISEPYLGPPLVKLPSQDRLKLIIQELADLYLKFLSNARFLIKEQGRIVIALPVFQTKKLRYLPIIDELDKIGYNIVDLLENLESWKKDVLTEYNNERNTIIYSRPGQFIAREIIVLEKV